MKRQTFVMTAMEANELPKLIPTIVCEEDWISIGPPFGIWPLTAIGGGGQGVNRTGNAVNDDDDQMR